MSSYETKFEERENGNIAYIYFNTSSFNTLTGDQLYELKDLMWDTAEKADLIILTSENPKFFCNGLDPMSLINASIEERMKTIDMMIQIIYDLYDLPVPFIAEQTGHTMAGGLVITASAEYRYMLRGKFLTGLSEIPVGLVLPSIYLEVIKEYVEPRYIRDVFEGKMFTPEEAYQIGLVDKLADSREELRKIVLKKADQLLAFSKQAYQYSRIKRRRLRKEELKKFLDADKEILTNELMENELPKIMMGIISKAMGKK